MSVEKKLPPEFFAEVDDRNSADYSFAQNGGTVWVREVGSINVSVYRITAETLPTYYAHPVPTSHREER